jgi:hypothetical protein
MSTSDNAPAQNHESRRDQILAFFRQHIGTSFPTVDLHAEFGSAFRTRVSELNRDLSCPITIHNHTERLADGAESSCYWAEWKNSQPAIAWQTSVQESLFGDLAPERYPD